jgi:hypothetical protein
MFAAIGREALRHLNVPPRDSSPVPIVRGEVAAVAPDRPRAATAAAPVIGAPLAPALAEPAPAGADGQPVMPRLAGLSLRQAMEALAPYGARLEITGRGVVTSQSPLPGAPLPAGAVCRLHLASPAGRIAGAVAASLQP